jgi:hypothetical protein
MMNLPVGSVPALRLDRKEKGITHLFAITFALPTQAFGILSPSNFGDPT